MTQEQNKNGSQPKSDKKPLGWRFFILCALICALLVAGALYLLSISGAYPQGADTYYYLYKGGALLESIEKGVLWPLWDSMWGAGVQPLRYTGPIAAYVLAFCTWVAGGASLLAYVVFCGLVLFLGLTNWIITAARFKRPVLVGTVGILCFFLVPVLLDLLSIGNLPQALCLCILPLSISGARNYLDDGKLSNLPVLSCWFVLSVLCDTTTALIELVVFAIVLIVFGVIKRRGARAFLSLAACALGFLVCGLWWVPSLLGSGSSLNFMYATPSALKTEVRLEDDAKAALIDTAQEITSQRLALLDRGTLGSEGAYLLSASGDAVPVLQAPSWQGAPTKNNANCLEEAYQAGNFVYLFDRTVELGCDSVLLKLDVLDSLTQQTRSDIQKAAELSGYELVDSNDNYQLYHLSSAPSTFGVHTTYSALALGMQASELAYAYPALEVADSSNLSDYTFDDLKDYDVLYLDGFTYNNKEEAEELVEKLALTGTRVVIMADDMPADEHSSTISFLGVEVEQVSFTNGFPDLETTLGSYSTSLFPAAQSTWNTVCLSGVDEVIGTVDNNGKTLEFMGSKFEGQVVFVGLDLARYAALTNDASAQELLSTALGLDGSELPSRELVELDINQTSSALTIASPRANVNTTLAAQDIFTAKSTISTKHNLMQVGKGTTTISLTYPYFWQGLVVSIIGMVGVVVLVLARWLWQLYVAKRDEIVAKAEAAFEATAPIRAKDLADLEPWSAADWTSSQIQDWENAQASQMDETAPYDMSVVHEPQTSAPLVVEDVPLDELDASVPHIQRAPMRNIPELEQSEVSNPVSAQPNQEGERTMTSEVPTSIDVLMAIPVLDALSKRMDAEQWRTCSDVAQVVATYLSVHPRVVAVRYPGLKADPLFSEAANTLRSGFGPYIWYQTLSGTQQILDCTQETDARALVSKLEHQIS